MTTPKNPRLPVRLGPIGRRVSERLHQIRTGKSWTLRVLEAELASIKHPISNDGLSKIETGKRRVDVDDLVALAIALDVTPSRFLLPDGKPGDMVQLTENVTVSWVRAWSWAAGHMSLSPPGTSLSNRVKPVSPAFAELTEAVEGSKWMEANAPLTAHYRRPLAGEAVMDYMDDLYAVKKAVEAASERVPANVLESYLSHLAKVQRDRDDDGQLPPPQRESSENKDRSSTDQR